MKKLTMMFALLCMGANAQNSSLHWAGRFEGPGFEVGAPVAVDKNGNVHAVVMFDNQVDFDLTSSTQAPTVIGGFDFGVAKYTSSGGLLWVRHIGGPSDEFANSITVDNMGNVYVTGNFSDSVDFDPGAGVSLLYGADDDAFILKLDSMGNFGWVRQLEGTGYASGGEVLTDYSGNVTTAGTFDGSLDIDPGATTNMLTVTGSSDGFISKLDANGNYIYGLQIESQVGATADALSLDGTGNLYVAGVFDGQTDFDPGLGTSIITPSSTSAYVLKLSSAGTFQFVKEIGGQPTAIEVDASGAIYVSGYFVGIIDLDPGAATALFTAIQQDNFLLKLTASGAYRWAKQSGSADNVTLDAVSVGPGGNINLGGTFENLIDLDPSTAGTHTILATGVQDIYLSRLDSSGNFIWGGSIGGSDQEFVFDLVSDNDGNVVATGVYLSPDFDVDPGPATYSLGLSNPFFDLETFILKYSICDLIAAAPTPTALCAGESVVLSASSTGTVSWFSTASSSVTLGSGSSFTTAALGAGTQSFYAGSSNCGAGDRQLITVTVSAPPTLSVTASSSLPCADEPITYSLSGATSYSYNGSNVPVTFTASFASSTVVTIAGTGSNNCSASLSYSQQVSACTAVSETEASSLRVFPNPARDAVQVSGIRDGEIVMYNLLGAEVKRMIVNSPSNKIDISDLSPGMYLLKTGGPKSPVTRIIKE